MLLRTIAIAVCAFELADAVPMPLACTLNTTKPVETGPSGAVQSNTAEAIATIIKTVTLSDATKIETVLTIQSLPSDIPVPRGRRWGDQRLHCPGVDLERMILEGRKARGSRPTQDYGCSNAFRRRRQL
ncbi:hypothetical protein C8R43DRAFT_963289 [Mycena crocata]|nr:hypothetical protein C8R43DRAFT_963289 [Mycena crocata]